MKNTIIKTSSILIIVYLLFFLACKKEDIPKQFPPIISCPGIHEIEYGGEIYSTVLVGEQCWMTRNLNIGKRIYDTVNMKNNDTIEKHCYQNDSNYCTKMGGLYAWNELMQYSVEVGAQGICPHGWHIPTTKDFGVLCTYILGYSGYLMENDSSWGSVLNNICVDCLGVTGFELLPGGMLVNYSHGGNRYMGGDAFLWTSNKTYVNISSDEFAFEELYHTHKWYYSVRCIKDE